MLGNGLESLIPPRDDNNSPGNDPSAHTDLSAQQDVNAPQFTVQPKNINPASISGVSPPDNLPFGEAEFLPTEQESKTEQTKEEAGNHLEPEIAQKQNVSASEPQTSVATHNIKESVAPRRGPFSEEQKKLGEAVFYLEVDKIQPNPHQPRRNFEENALKELASSIREFGVLQPVVVTKVEKEIPTGTKVSYELIAGERRLMAVKLLGLPTIPAIIRNVGMERERLEIAVIENIQRENLNALEMARAYSRLTDEFRMTQREIASRLGKSRESVANTMRLLDLPSDIQKALSENKISESHGRMLLTIDDPALQKKIFNELLERPMTIRELQARVKSATPLKDKKETSPLAAELKHIQERLSLELGTPVEILASGDSESGGKITIRFFSPEELQSIVGKIASKEDI